MQLTIFDLAFYFWVGITFLVILVLIFLHRQPHLKLWFTFVLISFSVWIAPILREDYTAQSIGFYILPLVWIGYTLARTFPRLLPTPSGPPQPGEPRTTQEALHGTRGTEEALTLYFTLVFLVLITSLSLYLFAGRFYWQHWF